MSDALRQLDKEFAVRVLGIGCVTVSQEDFTNRFSFDVEVPRYTRSLDAVWEGVEKLHADGWHICLECADTEECGGYYVVALWKGKDFDKSTEHVQGTATTPAEALVRACLEAVK